MSLDTNSINMTNATISNSGANLLIQTGANKLQFTTVNPVSMPGERITMNGNIVKVASIKGPSSSDLFLEGNGTGSVIINSVTDTDTNEMVVSQDGITTFNNIPKVILSADAILSSVANELLVNRNFDHVYLSSFTPAMLTSGSMGFVYNSRAGKYMQIGRWVFFSAYIDLTSWTNAAPNLAFSLPVAIPQTGVTASNVRGQSLSITHFLGLLSAIPVFDLSLCICPLGYGASFVPNIQRAQVMFKRTLTDTVGMETLNGNMLAQGAEFGYGGVYYLTE